ncbi:hypothetical protein [Pseudoteredinibacter isoporae]|uniref:Uncharacterized protein n=1 Tax=Pseudoteredinibacter isoporae TaxID=570281 RepID=A0A7X0MUV9_9GAMM|nr:hypothetical protein [Pseudoteredinibacter isoporae]MBB6520713.1 hypothetical protein [Pseudoteredinibacter isoporae]NHO86280.1 hypothetical protein [Pseudoteredinibacter isoporae]NIB25269.1 hypothetical protein [Pseudoteredinibacter isoporae]
MAGLSLWYLLALVYNLSAYFKIQNGEAFLASSDPVRGTLFISLFMTVLGLKEGFPGIFKFVFPIGLSVLAYGGFVNHIVYWLRHGGASEGTGHILLCALSLNGFAVVCGVSLWWRELRGDRP